MPPRPENSHSLPSRGVLGLPTRAEGASALAGRVFTSHACIVLARSNAYVAFRCVILTLAFSQPDDINLVVNGLPGYKFAAKDVSALSHDRHGLG